MAQNQNNVILVNPNDALGVGLPADFKVAQPDDLTIFVELTTQKKSRSRIVVDDNGNGFGENNTGTVGKVNFISGSPFGKNNSLTTSYTDIGTASLQNNGADLEGFGIESIDITFDTAYTPLIKIKFVDVRGGMFQRGSESKYSVFFELPYPLFNLKVKGYYGRTVSYCLHLVKWNSLFNSSTGNFEIDAEFIGYTFAILTDLLVGYLRAIPYVTGDGTTAFNRVKEKYEFDLKKANNLAGNQVITIDEMFDIISNFQGELKQINKDSETFKKLLNAKKSVEAINNIKKRNNQFLVDLNKEKNSLPISDISNIVFVKNLKSDEYNTYVNDMKTLISELEKLVSGISDVQKNLLSEAIITSKINTSDIIDSSSTTTNVVLVNNPNQVIVDKVTTTNAKYDITNSVDNNRLTNIVNQIKKSFYENEPNSRLAVNGYYIYDFNKFAKTLNNIITLNSKIQNDLIVKYQEELRSILLTTFNFNPSIENVIRILMASAETFLTAVQSVSARADVNTLRDETLQQLITNTSNNLSDIPISKKSGEKTKIYPFPLYSEIKPDKNNKNQIAEAWLGDNNVIDTSVVDEIEFTEKLLETLVKLKQGDINRELDLDNSSAWFSVNPLDTIIYNTVRNPYYKLSSTAIAPDDYVRLLMYRTFTFLGLTNPYTLDNNSLQLMASVEANNLFYGFPKAQNNTATSTIKTLIYENYKDADSIINHWLEGSDKIKNYDGINEKKRYMTPLGDSYAYRYIFGVASGGTKTYIPISGDYSGEGFFQGGILKTPSELRNLTIDYLGNYINSDESNGFKVDDNAKYLDIISYERYVAIGGDYNLPSDRFIASNSEDFFYNKNIKGKNINQNKLDTDNATEIFDSLSYEFYSNEFFKIEADEERLTSISNGSVSDVSAAFLLDTKKGTRLAEPDTDNGQNVKYYNSLINNTNGENIILKNISFVSNTNYNNIPAEISLFGSPLYYAQNAIQDPEIRNYAKAYLFLNTLPLVGLYGDRDKIKTESYLFFGTNVAEDLKQFTLFNDFDSTPTKLLKSIFTKNAGFIKSPSLWLAWLGSIIWRYEEFLASEDPIKKRGVVDNQPVSLVLAREKENKRHPIMPTANELFHTRKPYISESASMVFFLDKSDDENLGGWKYVSVDKAILGLPQQAKDILLDFFDDWTKNQFEQIKTQYQLFNDTFINFTMTLQGSVEMRPWVNYFNGLMTQNPNTSIDSFTASILEAGNAVISGSVNGLAVNNISNDFGKPSKMIQAGFTYSADTFFLPYLNIELDSDVNKAGNSLARQLFRQLSVIVNFTPRTFNYVTGSDIRNEISVKEDVLKKYLDFFTKEYQRLYDLDQEAEVDTSARDAVFGSGNLTFIKLNIYRHLKAINDKWITSYSPNSLISPCGESNPEDTLISRFLFIDKNWDEIGNEFIINPFDTETLLRSKYNQSLYDVLSNILSKHNFNFISLPNYVEYTTESQMRENVFKPYPYVDMVRTSDYVGPKFICMYIGQTSTHLSINNSENVNDGINLGDDGDNSLKDLTKPEGSRPIPAFEVNYGTQNQNFFKDLKLDQREFVETQESLEIIDKISTSGDKNVASFASQNLFNVYQTRSYSAEVTALGMPLIQPMMYFQLNNVPMFRGAYVIISTSHSIKPNHMTTTFKGVRVKKENTPINKQIIAIKDLNIDETNISGSKYNINETIYDGSVSPNRSNSAGAPIVDIAATGDIYIDSFKQRLTTTTNNMINFDRPSNTKKNGQIMTFNQIFNEIGGKLRFNVELIKIMSVMESQGGTGKGGGDGINSLGYVGLMQFGWAATFDVTKRINNYLSTQITINEYEFYGPLVDGKIKYPDIYRENQWPKPKYFSNPNVINDRTNNSMFDDYISTLAGIYYAFANIDGLENTPSIGDPTQIYIAHQQGKGGLRQINEFIDRNISDNKSPVPTNMQGNYPPILPQKGANGKDKTKNQIFITNQDWYTGWAANVHAAGYRINPKYIPKDPFKPVFNKATGSVTTV